jgi:hypothetical protein
VRIADVIDGSGIALQTISEGRFIAAVLGGLTLCAGLAAGAAQDARAKSSSPNRNASLCHSVGRRRCRDLLVAYLATLKRGSADVGRALTGSEEEAEQIGTPRTAS